MNAPKTARRSWLAPRRRLSRRADRTGRKPVRAQFHTGGSTNSEPNRPQILVGVVLGSLCRNGRRMRKEVSSIQRPLVSTGGSSGTPKQAGWTRSPSRHLLTSAPAACATCEALREPVVLGSLRKASRKHPSAGRQELRTAKGKSETPIVAVEEDRPLLVGPCRQPTNICVRSLESEHESKVRKRRRHK